MSRTIVLGDLTMDVVQKDIKNVHLSVYPPIGRVRIAAPSHMTLAKIRLFAITKLGWIKEQQRKLREQEREAEREYVTRESHFVWGRRRLLTVIESASAPEMELRPSTLIMKVRPGATVEDREYVISAWYRSLIRTEARPLIDLWAPRIAVTLHGFFVRHMKTKWGSCNADARTIRLNTELAKKPKECLEYIIVHELVHLRERGHSRRFQSIMDSVLPNWRSTRDLLNRLPTGHETWE